MKKSTLSKLILSTLTLGTIGSTVPFCLASCGGNSGGSGDKMPDDNNNGFVLKQVEPALADPPYTTFFTYNSNTSLNLSFDDENKTKYDKGTGTLACAWDILYYFWNKDTKSYDHVSALTSETIFTSNLTEDSILWTDKNCRMYWNFIETPSTSTYPTKLGQCYIYHSDDIYTENLFPKIFGLK